MEEPRSGAAIRRIISFYPNDVAIICFVETFTGSYADEGYNHELFRGDLAAAKIMASGRGINQIAQGSGTSATPSQADGQFRLGYHVIESNDPGKDGGACCPEIIVTSKYSLNGAKLVEVGKATRRELYQTTRIAFDKGASSSQMTVKISASEIKRFAVGAVAGQT